MGRFTIGIILVLIILNIIERLSVSFPATT